MKILLPVSNLIDLSLDDYCLCVSVCILEMYDNIFENIFNNTMMTISLDMMSVKMCMCFSFTVGIGI